jgi:hypothetical protein
MPSAARVKGEEAPSCIYSISNGSSGPSTALAPSGPIRCGPTLCSPMDSSCGIVTDLMLDCWPRLGHMAFYSGLASTTSRTGSMGRDRAGTIHDVSHSLDGGDGGRRPTTAAGSLASWGRGRLQRRRPSARPELRHPWAEADDAARRMEAEASAPQHCVGRCSWSFGAPRQRRRSHVARCGRQTSVPHDGIEKSRGARGRQRDWEEE